VSTVLVIEDNSINMKLFVDLLQSEKYDIICSPDGMPGFALAREQRPDLVILDVQLRDVSGLEVARLIRQDPVTALIPILAVTAFAGSHDRESILSSGCNAYLSKPIKIMEFLVEVASLLKAAHSIPPPKI